MKWFVLALFVVLATTAEAAMRQQPEGVPAHAGGGEASLVLPDLGQVSFLGYNSRTLLVGGLDGPRVSDGVDGPTQPATRSFPYLVSPNPDPPDVKAVLLAVASTPPEEATSSPG